MTSVKATESPQLGLALAPSQTPHGVAGTSLEQVLEQLRTAPGRSKGGDGHVETSGWLMAVAALP